MKCVQKSGAYGLRVRQTFAAHGGMAHVPRGAARKAGRWRTPLAVTNDERGKLLAGRGPGSGRIGVHREERRPLPSRGTTGSERNDREPGGACRGVYTRRLRVPCSHATKRPARPSERGPPAACRAVGVDIPPRSSKLHGPFWMRFRRARARAPATGRVGVPVTRSMRVGAVSRRSPAVHLAASPRRPFPCDGSSCQPPTPHRLRLHAVERRRAGISHAKEEEDAADPAGRGPGCEAGLALSPRSRPAHAVDECRSGATSDGRRERWKDAPTSPREVAEGPRRGPGRRVGSCERRGTRARATARRAGAPGRTMAGPSAARGASPRRYAKLRFKRRVDRASFAGRVRGKRVPVPVKCRSAHPPGPSPATTHRCSKRKPAVLRLVEDEERLC